MGLIHDNRRMVSLLFVVLGAIITLTQPYPYQTLQLKFTDKFALSAMESEFHAADEELKPCRPNGLVSRRKFFIVWPVTQRKSQKLIASKLYLRQIGNFLRLAWQTDLQIRLATRQKSVRMFWFNLKTCVDLHRLASPLSALNRFSRR